MSRWDNHPGVRSDDQLTRGERAADVLRNAMGSWGFVIGALGFLGVWMCLNALALMHHWDPYPFVLLNLVLSCLAALQGAILLIAAKRQDQISSELARHDYETNQEALKILKELHDLQELWKCGNNRVQTQGRYNPVPCGCRSKGAKLDS